MIPFGMKAEPGDIVILTNDSWWSSQNIKWALYVKTNAKTIRVIKYGHK